MKKFVVLALAAAACGSVANGAIVFKDSFPTDGNIVGTTPEVGEVWTQVSSAVGPVKVVDGKLMVYQGSSSTIVGGVGRVQDLNAPFAGGTITANLFTSFDLTVSLQGAFGTIIPAAGSVLVSMQDTNATSLGNGQISILPGTAGNTTTSFRLGLSVNGQTTITSGNIPFNTSTKVVTGFSFTGKQSLLWINPENSSSTPALTSTTTSSFLASTPRQLFIRQGSGGSPASDASLDVMDNLVVATSFAEAFSGRAASDHATIIPGIMGQANATVSGFGGNYRIATYDPADRAFGTAMFSFSDAPNTVIVAVNFTKAVLDQSDIDALSALGTFSSTVPDMFGTNYDGIFTFSNVTTPQFTLDYDFTGTGLTLATLAVVPEPSAVGLLIPAGLALVARRRR